MDPVPLIVASIEAGTVVVQLIGKLVDAAKSSGMLTPEQIADIDARSQTAVDQWVAIAKPKG